MFHDMLMILRQVCCFYVPTLPLQAGRRAIPMDVKFSDGPEMDLRTSEGFCSALYQCCRLSPGSGAFLAPVCSTFVFTLLS